MASAVAGDDLIQSFQLEALGIRGRLVRLGSVPESVIGAHDYPDVVAGLLGETLALAAALADALKFDGVFSLQTKGDGPISMLVADITSAGEMRGYAAFDAARLNDLAHGPETGAARAMSVPRLLGAGHLAFTVDQGPETDRYQGIVELSGATLAECAHQYFRQSEQIETGIRLAAGKGSQATADAGWRAGAVMLQRMPTAPAKMAGAMPFLDDEAEEGWRRALILMGTLTDGELLDPGLAPNDLLYRLFHEESVRVYAPRGLRHHCRCSAVRVERMLAALPREEIEDLKVDGEVVVTCQFCNARYVYDEVALAALHEA